MSEVAAGTAGDHKGAANLFCTQAQDDDAALTACHGDSSAQHTHTHTHTHTIIYSYRILTYLSSYISAV